MRIYRAETDDKRERAYFCTMAEAEKAAAAMTTEDAAGIAEAVDVNITRGHYRHMTGREFGNAYPGAPYALDYLDIWAAELTDPDNGDQLTGLYAMRLDGEQPEGPYYLPELAETLDIIAREDGITNSAGVFFGPWEWDAIVNQMDGETCEALNFRLAPCSNQEFFDAYAAAHLEKFGEVWELDKANPVW